MAEGKFRECQLIRGTSKPEDESAGRLKRTLCIDEALKVVAWEKTEGKFGNEVYTYDRIERGVDLTTTMFVFEPPSGSGLTELQLPTPAPLGTHNMPRDSGVTMPRLVAKVEPGYDEASRQAKIQGVVVLYAVIDAQGLLSEIYVLLPLTPGLDANAISAVKKWRFSPAIKDGKPVVVGVTIEVNFRLA
jgi:TonB family protein